jgi:hypothetical protein
LVERERCRRDDPLPAIAVVPSGRTEFSDLQVFIQIGFDKFPLEPVTTADRPIETAEEKVGDSTAGCDSTKNYNFGPAGKLQASRDWLLPAFSKRNC